MNRLVVILAGIVALVFAGDGFAQKAKKPSGINANLSRGPKFKTQLTGTFKRDGKIPVKVQLSNSDDKRYTVGVIFVLQDVGGNIVGLSTPKAFSVEPAKDGKPTTAIVNVDLEYPKEAAAKTSLYPMCFTTVADEATWIADCEKSLKVGMTYLESTTAMRKLDSGR